MLNILWHNLRISALYWLLVVPVWVMGALSTIRHGDAYCWWGVVFALTLAGLPEAIRWRADSDRLIHSLPVSRTDVVRGRVLAAVVVLLAAWLLTAVLAAALAAVSLAARGVWLDWVEPSTALVWLAITAPLVAIETVAFHRWPAGWAAGIVIVALMLVFAASQWSVAGASGGVLTGADGMRDVVRHIDSRAGVATAWAGTAAAAVAAFLAAVHVSAWMDCRRDF